MCKACKRFCGCVSIYPSIRKKVNLRSNEQMRPRHNKTFKPNNEKHIGSSVMHTVSPEQGTTRQDSSSQPPVCSNDSDHSVVVNPVDWTYQDDMYKKEIMSSTSVNTLEQLNDQQENHELENNELVPGNLENPNNSDANDDDDSGRKYDYSDEESEPSSTFVFEDEIWNPPEPENEEDNQDNPIAMATLQDDCDDNSDYDDEEDNNENSNHAEFAKPSSLSSSNEGVSSSHHFEAEREKAIKEVMNGKFKNLVSQLLQKIGAYNCDSENESWVTIVTELAWQAASLVKPDTTESKTMDPTNYVKVKCIATGSRSDSQLVEGLVFKKHAAHKHMATKYENPRLLLIQGMLAPSPMSSGLASFDSMMGKGSEVIDDLIENLQACRPNVILVEKSTSRAVCDKLLDLKITLVLDMKLHRLQRIESCTGSPIQSTVAPLNRKLKGCRSLYFEKFVEEHGGKKPSKTLMFLEGCPKQHGCTILLKGSSIEELKKIKCVAQCAVLMAYNFILETSFLVDQNAMFSTMAFHRAVENSLNNGHSSVIPGPTSIPLDQQLNDGGASAGDQILIPNVNYNEGFSHVQESAHYQETALKYAIEEVSYASPQTFQMMATFIDLDRRKPDTLNVGSPGSLANEEFDEVTVNAKGSSIENTLVDNQSQLLSSCAHGDSRQYDDNDVEAYMQSKDEISSVLDSESILVLMSRRNASRGTICEQSHLSHIKFYRNLDNTLGKFLRENLFNQHIPCEACGEPREAHIYYYTHHNRQLTIRVKRLAAAKLPRESEGKIWMWSRCGKCEQDKENATKRVLISNAASSLSFGKFLELSFSSQSSFNRLSNCGHSFQKDFLYFFGLGSMVAMFQYSRVVTYTVSVPPQKLKFHSSINVDWRQHEIDTVYAKGLLLFAEISDYLKKIDSRFSGSELVLNGSDVEGILKLERSEFEENIKSLGSKNENLQNSAHILLKLNRLRWETLLEGCIWNRRLNLLLSSSSNSPNATATIGAVEKGMKLKEDSGVVEKPKEVPEDSEYLPPNLGSIGESRKTDNIPISDNQSEDESISITVNPPSCNDTPEILSYLATLYSEDPTVWVWKPFGKVREECMEDLQDGLMPKFGHSSELLPTISQVIIEEGSRLHIPLNDGNFIVSDYESEISSIVACALASRENPKPDLDSSLKLSCDLELPVTEFSASHMHPEVNLGSKKFPPKGKYSVVILFANEFQDLRKDCCLSELDFIASLCRCKSWDAKGGKSKAAFAKTLDDRLIVKEIKKTEYVSFMEFSAQYFDYMKQSFKLGNQTCLAKIFGIYQVTIRNSKTGKDTKHDLMVQENLTFGRNITRQYDLKGALHARLATADGRGDVLLDQNFVNDMNSSPLYVGQKAKRLLQRAVWNDTTFLNSINVMDYSLLVGVDMQRRELVCGIIDYLRQYTWDKQLENWVKTSLVVPKNTLPTIISPKEYKRRFRKFMDTHFLVVPDNWCSHRSSNPCKLCGIRTGDSSSPGEAQQLMAR